PQTFQVTAPFSASADSLDGASTAGAGSFSDAAAEDAYVFTVPAGGQHLTLNLDACPASNAYYHPAGWQLINTANQKNVDSGGCSFQDLGTVPAGTYELLVEAAGAAGNYTLNVDAP